MKIIDVLTLRDSTKMKDNRIPKANKILLGLNV